MVIGGIALIARGVRRFTTDIDAAVRGDAVRVADLVSLLAKHGIQPRIPDAVPFAEENLVLLLRHMATGVDLDVSFAWSAFEHDALAGCTLTDFGRVRVPMSTPEDLVVFKAIAGRPKDVEDAEALLTLYPAMNLARVRKRVAELSGLAEAPHILEAFDAMTHSARGTPARSPARKKKRPRTRKPSKPR